MLNNIRAEILADLRCFRETDLALQTDKNLGGVQIGSKLMKVNLNHTNNNVGAINNSVLAKPLSLPTVDKIYSEYVSWFRLAGGR